VSALAWEAVVVELLELLRSRIETASKMRAKTDDEGRVVMPSFDELLGEKVDERAIVLELLRAAAKIDPKVEKVATDLGLLR
jgi:hypothetical protein